MSDRHDLAARFALLKAIGAKLSDAKKAADCEIRDTWEPGDRNTAKLPDGTPIGSVTLAKGRAVARLVNDADFLKWVEKTHPEHVETVTITRVDPAFTERIMSAARQLGVAVDAETGEEVPGIRVELGDPYPTTRMPAEAAEAIARAWQSGELAEVFGGLLRPAVDGPDEVAEMGGR